MPTPVELASFVVVVPPLAFHIQSTKLKLDAQSFVLNSNDELVGGLYQLPVVSKFVVFGIKTCVEPSTIPLELSIV